MSETRHQAKREELLGISSRALSPPSMGKRADLVALDCDSTEGILVVKRSRASSSDQLKGEGLARALKAPCPWLDVELPLRHNPRSVAHEGGA
jgi:hypothetical protein